MVTVDLPMKMLGTGRRLRALRHRLRADLGPMYRRQDPAYEREADLWLAGLRKAYGLIEDGVLNSVVRRFNAFVRVGRLRGVQCTPDVIERIEKGMRKAAPKTHHEALELQPTARAPEQLAALLDELATLVTDLKADRDESDDAVAASGNVSTGDRSSRSMRRGRRSARPL